MNKLFSPKDESERETCPISQPATREDLTNLGRWMGAKLEEILAYQKAILRTERQIMATLDDVAGAVNEESTVEDSVLTLLTSIKAQLDAAGGNQAKIDQIFSGLQANKAKLAAALLANTPQAP